MILQALYEYAQRKGDELPEDGFELKEFKYLIKIKPDGTFVDLLDMQERINKKPVGKTYKVPAHIARSGSKSFETTFLLWDHYGYILSEPKKEKDAAKQEKAQIDASKQNETFISMVENLPQSLKSVQSVAAVSHFYKKYKAENYASIRQHELWQEIAKIPGCNLTFIVEGDDEPVPCLEEVAEYQRSLTDNSSMDKESGSEEIRQGVCLITGEVGVIARLHAEIPNVSDKSNAKLVGFQKNSGYDSYGKEQSYNAPVSKKAEATYSKALKYLTSGKNHKFRLGSDTIVFWAEKAEAESFESSFPCFFATDFDDPDRGIIEVKNLFSAIKTGKLEKLDSNFYVLGLSPNAARISVRFWESGKVETFARRIEQHFKDLELVRSSLDEKEYLNLFQLLTATALDYKMDNVAPNLVGAVIQSILEGFPYPKTLQQQCIRRIRAEQKVTRTRAAILKAYLNRLNRYKNLPEEISVALDRTNTNKGYLLGRLFAVFEKVQQDTHPGLNATITDRFYGAASTNPVTVFAQLAKLNQHHLSSYDKTAFRVNREKEIGEIMNALDFFPAHLDLAEQSQFAIGYYHEKQSFYNKADKSEGEN